MVRAATAMGALAERLPLGVALDRWPASPPRSRDLDRPARLIHVANLSRVKDQPTLLRALRRVLDGGTSLHLDVVGEDTTGGRVERMAAELGLQDHLTFHGFLPHAELRALVEAADLHVFSSRWEADPIALLEAAVAGIPTVGTAVGHMLDWSPSAALAVPVGDAVALADGIEALLADEPRRMEVARAAQARALVHDADWSARRVLELYEELTR
jgi:glycosyltransferase involved in cell wall biosynthesis